MIANEYLDWLKTEMETEDIIRRLYVGKVNSDWRNGDQAEVAGHINELFIGLGGTAVSWQDAVIGGDIRAAERYKMSASQILSQSRNIASLGDYFTQFAYNALPIEGGAEEGDFTTRLSVAVGTEHILDLYAEGAFETIWSDDDDPDSELEVPYYLSYEANIYKIAP